MIGLVRIDWSGGPGGSGVTTLCVNAGAAAGTMTPADAQVVVNAVDTWLGTWAPAMPTAYTGTVRPTIDIHDQVTGTLTAAVTAPTPKAGRAGTMSAVWAAGVGARVIWDTGTIVNGRRVKGSTYLVPLTSFEFEADGTIKNASITAWNTSSATLISTLKTPGWPLCVWSRPDDAKGRPGVAPEVTSARVADKTSWLRTRRT